MKGGYGSEEADQKDRLEKWVGVPGEEESSRRGIVEGEVGLVKRRGRGLLIKRRDGSLLKGVDA
jgi:hypothetical protein